MTKFKKGDKVWVECVVTEDYATRSDDVLVTIEKHGGESIEAWIDTKNVIIQPIWTPVGDGLPEEQGKYLCTTGCGFIALLNFGQDDYFYSLPHVPFDDIIAWQPLPAPYVPPVELKKSCERCKHLVRWPSGANENNRTSDVCSKLKIVCPIPHLRNNKPCHEDDIYAYDTNINGHTGPEHIED